MKDFVRALPQYAAGGAKTLAGLGPRRFTQYFFARIYAFFLNYEMSERYFLDIGEFNSPKEIAGIFLSDFANNQLGVGELDNAANKSQASQRIFREIYENLKSGKSARDDGLLMGQARGLIEEQMACCFRGNMAECQRLHDESRAILLDEMGVKDYYGLSKTYQGLGWCRLLKGMIDENWNMLRESANHMVRSYEYACKIKAYFLEPIGDQSDSGARARFDFFLSFRDGLSQGGVWRRMIMAGLATDIHIQLGDLRKANHFYDLVNAEYQGFFSRLVPKLPPFVPFYSWRLDLLNETQTVDFIDAYLKWRVNRAKEKRFNLYVPLMYISYGDFLVYVKRNPDLSQQIHTALDDAWQQYSDAKSFAEHYGYKLMAELADVRLRGFK